MVLLPFDHPPRPPPAPPKQISMRKYLPLLICAIPAIVSCRSKSTGLLQAEQTGDLSNPKAERVDALQAFDDACGDLNTSDLGQEVFERMPYLEQLAPTSTRVTWSSRQAGELVVDVFNTDGELVDTFPTELQEEATYSAADQWTAKMEGLEADTIYCYSIRDSVAEQNLISEVGFRTGAVPGAESRPTKFVVIGDSGEGSEDQAALVEQMKTVQFDFMLHVGDMAYDSGTFEEFQKNYFEMYEELFSHVAVFPSPGNHEYETADAGPYRAVFNLPNNERWYSFDQDDVHFVALDTEQMGEEQARWLEADLKKSDKPWTVAYMHKPPYSSGSHGSFTEGRDLFEPIFQKHGVQLVLTGHDHHYERTKEMGGVTYYVTGGGGAETYAVNDSDFTAFATEVIHFLYVTVEGDTLSVHAIDGTGQEFDQLVLKQ